MFSIIFGVSQRINVYYLRLLIVFGKVYMFLLGKSNTKREECENYMTATVLKIT